MSNKSIRLFDDEIVEGLSNFDPTTITKMMKLDDSFVFLGFNKNRSKKAELYVTKTGDKPTKYAIHHEPVFIDSVVSGSSSSKLLYSFGIDVKFDERGKQ